MNPILAHPTYAARRHFTEKTTSQLGEVIVQRGRQFDRDESPNHFKTDLILCSGLWAGRAGAAPLAKSFMVRAHSRAGGQ